MLENNAAVSRTRALSQLAIVVALTGIFLALMSADTAIDAGIGPKVFLLARILILVLLCTFFLRQSGESWRDVGLRAPRRWWVVPLLVIGGFILLVVLSISIAKVILPALGAEPPHIVRTPTWEQDWAEYLYWAFPVAWGSAAFGEEMLARGFILDRLMKLIGSTALPAAVLGVVLQAAIFGAFHAYQGTGGMLLTGATGLLLGMLWLCGGRNLWPCIILHGVVDFLAASGM